LGIRTDLAIENVEILDENTASEQEKVEIPGVEVEDVSGNDGIRIFRVRVTGPRGAQILGKPEGEYITIEADGIVGGEDCWKETVARAAARELSRLIPFHDRLKALVIGLGNDEVTPDSLGPRTAAKVRVTRHIFLLCDMDHDEEMACVSVLTPGVMASTGMETAELIQKAVTIARPDVILAVDALAARNVDRISTTIQITNTGISPGAGTGNMRKQLTEASVGAKVVAIGVPTVIDANTLIMDSLGDFLSDPEGAAFHLEKKGAPMIVTSSQIDEVIADFSQVIADAINITLHPGIYS